MKGELTFEGAGDQERVDGAKCLERAGKGRPGLYGKREGALVHQQGKQRRQERGRALRDVPGEAWEGEGPQSRAADSSASWDTGPTWGLGCVKNSNHCCGEAIGPEGMGNKRLVMSGEISAGS